MIATGLDAFYLIIFEFLLEMGRRLSNKKAFSNSASSSVWFLIPAEMLVIYAEGDTLGEGYWDASSTSSWSYNPVAA